MNLLVLINSFKKAVKAVFYKLGVPDIGENILEFDNFYLDYLSQSIQNRSSNFVKEALQEISDERIIYKKGEGPEVVLRKDDQLIPLKGQILLEKYFISRTAEEIKKSLNHDGSQNPTALDTGTSSGIYLQFLKMDRLGINISKGAVENTIKNGALSIVGDSDYLPFKKKSFDFIFCFNTLEHFENPIKALNELKRIARKSILIVIPLVEKTNICPPLEKDESRGRNRWHFFEFCHEDLLRVLDFNGLECIKWEILKPPFRVNDLKSLIFYLRYRKLALFYGRSFYELKITKDD